MIVFVNQTFDKDGTLTIHAQTINNEFNVYAGIFLDVLGIKILVSLIWTYLTIDILNRVKFTIKYLLVR